MHFGNDRIISCHFPKNWPSRSPDLNSCDFGLWGYLKHAVFSGLITNLAELKTRAAQHIQTSAQIYSDLLRTIIFRGLNLWSALVKAKGRIGLVVRSQPPNQMSQVRILIVLKNHLLRVYTFNLKARLKRPSTGMAYNFGDESAIRDLALVIRPRFKMWKSVSK
ncbi:hypothetical protein AVEN_63830-1 [Araneus ventricosus]|uniref:Uncharacterized protein n=1 Tax=Araneus ventricosus TaxID=182803 RepID=A0A4Y2FXS6_ARAVE|nr:hypothetical protein AVEN_63830-1 [Araneus ventricosus]